MWSQQPNIALCGSDTSFGEGVLKVVVSVTSNGNYEVNLVVRDKTPAGEVRYAFVNRVLDNGVNNIGLEVPLTEQGTHEIDAIVRGQLTPDGDFRDLFFVAPAPITVLPEARGLLVTSSNITNDNGQLRVCVAVERTRPDAPVEATLLVRDLAPTGEKRAATATKALLEEGTTVLGLEAPLDIPGAHNVEITVCLRDAEGVLEEIIAVNPDRI
eukprot:CAMPEP_0114555662 /NCGR_PEP_ID=MMETSP0114-20121206/8873_1 /TAXON_ID=31324 /ORGANISM="Goniomonas sp, Strain m" /LENGTH=212 /DNA_ID=CAMNT_0001740811 /DNA_START=9 /DNA_END=647 /DNA_ORIENTATION=+